MLKDDPVVTFNKELRSFYLKRITVKEMCHECQKLTRKYAPSDGLAAKVSYGILNV